MESRCSCGAAGRLLPLGFAYRPRDLRPPKMEWRGGRIGAGRVAVEDARPGVTACPACQHRACVYMLEQEASLGS